MGAYLVLWHFALRIRGLYNSYRLSPASREFKDLAAAVAIATVPLVPLSLPFGFEYVNPAFLVVFPTLAFAGLGFERRVLRAVARQVRSFGRNLRDVIIVGDGGPALDGAARLAQRDGLGYRVIEVLNVRSTITPIHVNGNGAAANGAGHAYDPLTELAMLLESRPIDEVFLGLPLDGYRAISFKTGGTLHLRSRNDNDFKELDPIPQFQATGKLAGFLQSAVAPA
jgi:hypothetical protein